MSTSPEMQQAAMITDAFERAAAEAGAAEEAFRKTAAVEAARLQAARVVAYRRVRLVKLLDDAARSGHDEASRAELQAERLCREVGWSRETPAHAEVLARLVPVCRAVAAGDAGTSARELAVFERWFEGARRTSFYAIFDTYVQETPVVDF